MKNIGIEVVDSSSYNPSSNGLVERSVRTLKQLLKKCGPINQLQLREMFFCSNSREQEGGQGSPLGRFLGHGIRTGLPNSLDRNLNWNHMMSICAEQHQCRVEKPGKTNKDQYSVWRHQKILSRLMNYYFKGTHIPGVDNRIADALSRLCISHFPGAL